MYNSAIKILNILAKFGYKAYIVGGYPRDLYLKRSSSDIDICTDATPKDIINIFDEVITTNSEYGSIIISFEKIKFEITTFRIEEKYIDFRRPSKITYTENLEDDLKRRDFTINTLCIDKDGNQIDLLNAKSDLDNKIIRMVGNPKIKLKEDALRILRAIRFATILDFELEPVLKVYIKKYASLVKKISKERQKEELDIIFSSSNKEYGIKLLNELKLSDYLEIPLLKKIAITPSMIVTWSNLNVLNKFPFNTNEKETIIKLGELQKKNLLDKRTLYEYGLYDCLLASELTNTSKKLINEIYAKMPIHSKTDIALKPEDICKILNKEPGSFLKSVISDLEEKILLGTIKNNKKEVEKYIIDNYK